MHTVLDVVRVMILVETIKSQGDYSHEGQTRHRQHENKDGIDNAGSNDSISQHQLEAIDGIDGTFEIGRAHV